MQIKNNILLINDIINKFIIILIIQTTFSSYVKEMAITFLNFPYYLVLILLYIFYFFNRIAKGFLVLNVMLLEKMRNTKSVPHDIIYFLYTFYRQKSKDYCIQTYCIFLRLLLYVFLDSLNRYIFYHNPSQHFLRKLHLSNFCRYNCTIMILPLITALSSRNFLLLLLPLYNCYILNANNLSVS